MHFTEEYLGFCALTVHVKLSSLLFGEDACTHIGAHAFIYLGVFCRWKKRIKENHSLTKTFTSKFL